MSDQLAVRGIEVHAHHGVLDFERRDGQTFLVDLLLDLDTRPAAARDDLSRTVDYGALVPQGVPRGEKGPGRLIETPAQRIPGRFLGPGQVVSVQVTVHKPH